jgi:hypothetical protein
MYGMLGMPPQGFPQQGFPPQGFRPQNMPMTTYPQPALQPQQYATPPQPSTWQVPQRQQQPTPSLGYLAGATAPSLPAKVRGVSAEPSPAPLPVKFVLPSPEALGLATPLTVKGPSAPPVPNVPNVPNVPAVRLDWNQAHARMERLGVLRFQKDHPPTGGVRVTLLLPTADPTRGQPIEASAATEAAAVLAALQRAETWLQQR